MQRRENFCESDVNKSSVKNEQMQRRVIRTVRREAVRGQIRVKARLSSRVSLSGVRHRQHYSVLNVGRLEIPSLPTPGRTL